MIEFHGEGPRGKNTPEYRSWNAMIGRCENPKNVSFRSHGARGISVCKRWRKSYLAFLSDMGRRPTVLHTLERTDNNGGYAPENCRWATRAEQSQNRRNVLRYQVSGLLLHTWEMASVAGIKPHTLRARLRRGWSAEKATMTPVRSC